MQQVSQHIDSKAQELKALTEEVETLRKVAERVPDLSVHTDRWSNQRFSSATVNGDVDDLEISHNCGCCNDSPLEVKPFTVIEGVKVFSEPVVFTVGERNPHGYGEIEQYGWEREMRKAGISDPVIIKVREYLDTNKAVDYEDDSDDY